MKIWKLQMLLLGGKMEKTLKNKDTKKYIVKQITTKMIPMVMKVMEEIYKIALVEDASKYSKEIQITI